MFSFNEDPLPGSTAVAYHETCAGASVLAIKHDFAQARAVIQIQRWQTISIH